MPANWYTCGLAQFSLDTRKSVPSEQEITKVGTAAIDGFHELFVDLTRELKIRDEWKQFCQLFTGDVGVIEQSQKSGIEITLSVSIDGWSVSSHLRYANHIRHMSDEFWQHIAKLSQIGTVEPLSSSFPRGLADKPENKRLVQHSCSLVFSLARDYIMLEQLPICDAMNGGLGSIHVTLPIDTQEEKLRHFYKEGVRAFFQANYLLYRSQYLEHRRQLKKRGCSPEQIRSFSQTFGQPTERIAISQPLDPIG